MVELLATNLDCELVLELFGLALFDDEGLLGFPEDATLLLKFDIYFVLLLFLIYLRALNLLQHLL